MEQISDLISGVKDLVKDKLSQQIDSELIKNVDLKDRIEKKIEIQDKIKEYIKYIDNQIGLINKEIEFLKEEFKASIIKQNTDDIMMFTKLSNIESECLSLYTRNKISYEKSKILEKFLSKLLKSIWLDSGLLKRSDNKSLKELLEEEQVWNDMTELLHRFDLFFDIYVQLKDVLKQKGFLIKNMIDLIKFNEGNI